MHVEVAAREATRDTKRVAGGLAALFLGALLFALLLVMLQVAAACFLHERWTRPWTECALEVAALDLALGSLLLLAAKSRLSGPLMPETRSMISRTVDALTED
jgi:hypothetical protein